MSVAQKLKLSNFDTAVPRKVVLQTRKNERDNAAQWVMMIVKLEVFQRGLKETAQTRVFKVSQSVLLNHREPQSSNGKLLLPIIPIGIVAYAFTLLRDNLCRNSCIYV